MTRLIPAQKKKTGDFLGLTTIPLLAALRLFVALIRFKPMISKLVVFFKAEIQVLNSREGLLAQER